ncbi:NAD(P)H-dependent glycerol-3-phosphate dehydrogenase [Convivina praedatoris]|uniref:Glycerol-3-phosphate dehydrogenase [NAD(P)+] n=1 Tax=Convivina praedatoris TaxID=2880963 RepID=A0ABN8H9Q5_9LACO|nr:NAD(P)H-dependent glycerol-3-phosphate dehydrogenase [Convivina sp. LMG 32447]CAH1854124.1 Glycerol-3-phosphate dehydrogenase [NAD(P)+] [Convivina sp. LMG 32447]CAH1855369.1 Glycerol-3-phosphate dehydrogenase [NAD(P)+] [Convivina sp. LMG 32447]CAH1855468.1 Glycerol-3-phosphate dehydrogenase [NAD(P)+] [Convivina sp. LMG 32447]
MTKIAVLGAGSWGTALANRIASNGFSTVLWSHRAEQVEEINQTHTNADYLPGTQLYQGLQATADLTVAIDGADIILVVVPTKGIREVAQKLNKVLLNLQHSAIVVHATKGLEEGSHKRISEMLLEEMEAKTYTAIAAISGPSHAEDVVKNDLTAVSVASPDLKAAQAIQAVLASPTFRPYTNQDLLGSELGGALKNIIAIGSGMLVGLGYGVNAQAALLTRGLAELRRIGVAMGAQAETFLGLAGIGDLIVTGMSANSRNYRAGFALGQGQSLPEVQAQMGMVIEGVNTTKAVFEYAQQLDLEIPITQAIYQVLYQQADIRAEIEALMTRPLKSEN